MRLITLFALRIKAHKPGRRQKIINTVPVEQKFGPSTGHMMRNEEVIEKMDETIRDTYEKRIEHEILRVLNGWGG